MRKLTVDFKLSVAAVDDAESALANLSVDHHVGARNFPLVVALVQQLLQSRLSLPIHFGFLAIGQIAKSWCGNTKVESEVSGK